MSSTAQHGGGSAPWKPLFLTHISKMESPEFTMGSIATAPPGASTPYVPRVRTLIYRGMFGELPENKHNTAPKNPRVYESDMPTFTTDVRMSKVPEIFGSSAGHGKVEQSQGSGGGGPIEAVWWDGGVKTQWRVRGEAYIIGPDIEGQGEKSSGARTVKSELGKRLRIVGENTKEWSWAKELTAHFGNLSPMMRGSFKNPPPGTPKSKLPQSLEIKLAQKVDNNDDVIARENFRVVVIKPVEVEQLDLSDPVDAKRWKFTFVGEGNASEDEKAGEWIREELWP